MIAFLLQMGMSSARQQEAHSESVIIAGAWLPWTVQTSLAIKSVQQEDYAWDVGLTLTAQMGRFAMAIDVDPHAHQIQIVHSDIVLVDAIWAPGHV